jgi:hypothetical protein
MDARTRSAARRTPPVSRAQGNGSAQDQPAGTTATAREGAAPAERAKQQAVLVAIATPGGLAAAVIVWMTAFQIVSWTDFQTALVMAETAALIGFFGALVGHFWRDSSQEPVALAATFTATLAATLALCNGFGWLTWSQDQVTAVLGVFTTFLGVGTAFFARHRVEARTTPKKAATKGATTKLSIIRHPLSPH